MGSLQNSIDNLYIGIDAKSVQEAVTHAIKSIEGFPHPRKEGLAVDVMRRLVDIVNRGRNADTRDIFVSGGTDNFRRFMRSVIMKAALLLKLEAIFVGAANRPGSSIDVVFQTDNPGPYKGSHDLHLLRIVIIEEVSLMSAQTLETISRRIQEWNGEFNVPFGCCAMLFLGDLLQMPPAEGDRIFKSPLWKNVRMIPATSFDPWRGARCDSFRDYQDMMRVGDASCIPYFNELVLGATQDDSEWLADGYAPLIVATEKQADEYNKGRLGDMLEREGRVLRFQRTAARDPDPYEDAKLSRTEVDAVLPERVTLFRGALVVLTWDGPRGTYRNGDVGLVMAVRRRDIVLVKIHRTGQLLTVRPIRIECEGHILRGLPIKHAWAISVRESQGIRLFKALVDPDGLDGPGELYVALSRVVRRNQLRLLRRLSPEQLVVDADVFAEFARLSAKVKG